MSAVVVRVLFFAFHPVGPFAVLVMLCRHTRAQNRTRSMSACGGEWHLTTSRDTAVPVPGRPR
jgi:hypothetical protein